MFKLILFSGLFVLSSCAITTSNYMPMHKVAVIPKESEQVELLACKPQRKSLCLGHINADGNAFSNHRDLIKDVKKKAALLGGDFILQEKVGTQTVSVENPGYTTYKAQGNASFNANQGCSKEEALGYSVGPSTTTYNYPWGVYSVWVYQPTHHGVHMDDRLIITGFHLNSDAPQAGLRPGDQVIGIDGFDVSDEGLNQHLMELCPGSKVVMSVLRDGKRQDFTITELPN
jgi:hypothetical protein